MAIDNRTLFNDTLPVSVESGAGIDVGANISTGAALVNLTAATNTSLAASSASRKGLIVTAAAGNAAPLLINLGAAASATLYTASIAPGASLFIERSFWVGSVSGYSTAAATALVTVTSA